MQPVLSVAGNHETPCARVNSTTDTPTGKSCSLRLARLTRAQLDAAREGSRLKSQEVQNGLGDIFRSEFPIRSCARRIPREFGGDASGHDITDAYAIVADIVHERFTEAVEPELRRIVGRAASKRVGPGEARNIDDGAAS